MKSSPRLGSIRSLEEEADSSSTSIMCMFSLHSTRPGLGLHLQSARTALRRAQKATQESFATYTASLEAERRVSHEVAALEDRRDHLCN